MSRTSAVPTASPNTIPSGIRFTARSYQNQSLELWLGKHFRQIPHEIGDPRWQSRAATRSVRGFAEVVVRLPDHYGCVRHSLYPCTLRDSGCGGRVPSAAATIIVIDSPVTQLESIIRRHGLASLASRVKLTLSRCLGSVEGCCLPCFRSDIDLNYREIQ
jgi:hypothetical protein